MHFYYHKIDIAVCTLIIFPHIRWGVGVGGGDPIQKTNLILHHAQNFS